MFNTFLLLCPAISTTFSISKAWTLDQTDTPFWSFMTQFQTPQQFQPYPSFSRWRGVDAGGLLAVLVRYSSTAHTAVHTNRPPLRSWNSFSISTAEPMANNEMKMRMPKVIVFCVGLWESALLSGPLSLWQWPTENKSKSQSRGWPAGPPECRKFYWGQCFGRFFNPIPSRRPDYFQLISLSPPQFLTFQRPWLPHFTFRN